MPQTNHELSYKSTHMLDIKQISDIALVQNPDTNFANPIR